MNDTSLMVQNNRLAVMPVMDNNTAMMRRQAVIDFTRSVMKPDVDYGRVPGTNKDTLLKPGAEKLTSLFGLSPRFTIVEKETDWTGKEHGNEPFFYFQYRCSLYYGDMLAGEGVGSCNTWEKKYRYRNAERVCPDCGKPAIFKSKPRPNDQPGKPMGYYCWSKKGGCGSQFPAGDPRIESQEAGQVPNDNPADLVNTVDKMAQKRALVAAVLIAVNASEFFTQDIEDMDFGPADVIDVTPTSKAQQQPRQPATNVNGHTNGGKKAIILPNGADPHEGLNPPKVVTADELFPDISESLKRKFHAVGAKTYGDAWDDKRAELVSTVTKGKSRSSNDLTREQMEKLIDGMEKKAGQLIAVAENAVDITDAGYNDLG